jgi:hypothetical protein
VVSDGLSDAMLMFIDEPFPDYDWAANMNFEDFGAVTLG